MRGGDTIPLSGLCSSVSRTSEYIYASRRDVLNRRQSPSLGKYWQTFRNRSLGRCGNLPHCSARSRSSFVY